MLPKFLFWPAGVAETAAVAAKNFACFLKKVIKAAAAAAAAAAGHTHAVNPSVKTFF
ncbi:MAG: hypothetical protein ACK5O9_06920 [Holosporales bacterium]